MLTKKRSKELDVVRTLVDFPEYGIRRGETGVVISAFDEPEAYDLEFVDESGTSSRFAYSVTPDQIENLDSEAEEEFEHGMRLFVQLNLPEALPYLRRALRIKPRLIRVIHNSVAKSFEAFGEPRLEDWAKKVHILGYVVQLDPSYELARRNLATAYMQWGRDLSRARDFKSALQKLHLGLVIDAGPDIAEDLRNNIAATFTDFGLEAHAAGDFELAGHCMLSAVAYLPNATTRRNFAFALCSQGKKALDENDLEGAVRCFRDAELAGLNVPELLNDYGVVLARLKMFQDALRVFETALDLDPGNGVIRSNIEVVSRDLGVLREGANEGQRDLNLKVSEATQFILDPVPPRNGRFDWGARAAA
jgi:tetratricopeptide (TPR) repeat protein